MDNEIIWTRRKKDHENPAPDADSVGLAKFEGSKSNNDMIIVLVTKNLRGHFVPTSNLVEFPSIPN